LAPTDLPPGWVFPRRFQTPEGEVTILDHYRMRPGQVPVYGGEVLYDFDHSDTGDPD
jgi:hypothetical protein